MYRARRWRRGYKLLRERYPEADVVVFDPQPPQKLLAVGGEMIGVSAPGAWVCVDLNNGMKFAIWKETGNVYRVDEHGAAEDDPFIEVTKL